MTQAMNPVDNMQLLDFQESLCLDAGMDHAIAAALGVDWGQLLQHMVDHYTGSVWDAAYAAGPGAAAADTDWHDNRRGGEDMMRGGLRLSVAANESGCFWLAGIAVGDAGGFSILGHGAECSDDAAKSRAENFADLLSATLPAVSR